VDCHGETPIYPAFWEEYLQQQRESLEEAVGRLGGKEKKHTPVEAWDDAEKLGRFPHWVRNRPFVFRIKVAPEGNWSELIESSRPRFFDLPLYSEKGSVTVRVSIENEGLSKVIVVGGTHHTAKALSVGRPFALRFEKVTIGTKGLAQLTLEDVGLSGMRGMSFEVSCGDVQLDNLVPGATYPVMLFRGEKGALSGAAKKAVVLRGRWANDESNNLSKVSLALADFNLELDYESVSTMTAGIGAILGRAALATNKKDRAKKKTDTLSSSSSSVDEIDLAPFLLILSWQNPKLLIPLDVLSDDMLSIRHVRLQMPSLQHTGCAMEGPDLGALFGQYLKDSFVGQTVRILGSLDVLGNPTGLIVAFGSSIRFLQKTWVAAVEGNGQAMLDGATDTICSLGGAIMTPLVSFSNASARMVGDDGAVGTLFDLNRRTVGFVYSYLTNEDVSTPPPPSSQKNE
jgi:hypothetical protein